MEKRPSPLTELKHRIHAAKDEEPVSDGSPSTQQSVSLAMRLSVELVAGITVGAVGGWFMDDWLGTLPLFLIFGFLIGCAAGYLNMKRALKDMP